jgi:hypothetical protein
MAGKCQNANKIAPRMLTATPFRTILNKTPYEADLTYPRPYHLHASELPFARRSCWSLEHHGLLLPLRRPQGTGAARLELQTMLVKRLCHHHWQRNQHSLVRASWKVCAFLQEAGVRRPRPTFEMNPMQSEVEVRVDTKEIITHFVLPFIVRYLNNL